MTVETATAKSSIFDGLGHLNLLPAHHQINEENRWCRSPSRIRIASHLLAVNIVFELINNEFLIADYAFDKITN